MCIKRSLQKKFTERSLFFNDKNCGFKGIRMHCLNNELSTANFGNGKDCPGGVGLSAGSIGNNPNYEFFFSPQRSR